jgi:hypothetical protein
VQVVHACTATLTCEVTPEELLRATVREQRAAEVRREAADQQISARPGARQASASCDHAISAYSQRFVQMRWRPPFGWQRRLPLLSRGLRQTAHRAGPAVMAPQERHGDGERA